VSNEIEDIQAKILALGLKINAPKALTMVPSISPQNGKPHIEVYKGKYRYIIEERGLLIKEKMTKSLDELLYWIFVNITSQMAQDYEYNNRKFDQDFRRIMFNRQLELLGALSSEWQLRQKQEIEKILTRSPFIDMVSKPTKHHSSSS